MPFPLAHPAAVLPLRRFCPRYLSFSALIAGSLSPDFGYLFRHFHVDSFSHRFWAGGFGFCLPVGILLTGISYLARSPLIQLLPHRFQRLFRSNKSASEMFGFRVSGYFSPRWRAVAAGRNSLAAPKADEGGDFGFRIWSWLVLALSVLIGAWTHILLDSVSHPDDRAVELMPLLGQTVFRFGTMQVSASDLLYAGFTFCGAAWLAGTYLHWLARAAPAPALLRPVTRRSFALLFGAVTLVLALAGRGEHPLLGLAPLAIATAAVVFGFLAITLTLFSSNA